MTVPRTALATLLMLAACGGSERASSTDAGSGADGMAYIDAPSATCSAGGVRICGMGCPELDDTQCPGGCQPVSTLDGGQSTIGVCWSDDPTADVSCAVCADGQACLQRTASTLVCVPLDLCAELWSMGVQDVCRYADKSTFDDEQLATPQGCPANATPYICGGSCAACESEDRCVGRSPDHPFGICPPNLNQQSPNDPNYIVTCALVGAQYTAPCPAPLGFNGPSACAVFQTSGSDEAAAKLYGICVDQGVCLQTASVFPGGLQCYDSLGDLLQ